MPGSGAVVRNIFPGGAADRWAGVRCTALQCCGVQGGQPAERRPPAAGRGGPALGDGGSAGKARPFVM